MTPRRSTGPPFVYHLCLPDMDRTVLYPLDDLKDRLPDFYARERPKYEGRESVLAFEVPFLGVTWGTRSTSRHWTPGAWSPNAGASGFR